MGKVYPDSMFRLILLLFSVLLSCAPSSQEEYYYEGQHIVQTLTKKLQKIRSQEDLRGHQAEISQLFDQLIAIVIAAEKCCQTPFIEEIGHAEQIGSALQAELYRISCIEGGRAFLEKCQESSLLSLDRFKNRQKRQQKHF